MRAVQLVLVCECYIWVKILQLAKNLSNRAYTAYHGG